jgi:hypothetical protein
MVAKEIASMLCSRLQAELSLPLASAGFWLSFLINPADGSSIYLC